ncbi:hypothetical protein N658DRAFT_275318 [Parathielavia hyrcaniae]|uniref:Uncharacterized protein n=1 Tax=Parathielavia hyrcaniae TaxID=113614 RepID=A0AAN6T377_9PEZI|nr:hypothetical protein N658DRAFT_275318 [Parathielavia hyrcaniae]
MKPFEPQATVIPVWTVDFKLLKEVRTSVWFGTCAFFRIAIATVLPTPLSLPSEAKRRAWFWQAWGSSSHEQPTSQTVGGAFRSDSGDLFRWKLRSRPTLNYPSPLTLAYSGSRFGFGSPTVIGSEAPLTLLPEFFSFLFFLLNNDSHTGRRVWPERDTSSFKFRIPTVHSFSHQTLHTRCHHELVPQTAASNGKAGARSSTKTPPQPDPIRHGMSSLCVLEFDDHSPRLFSSPRLRPPRSLFPVALCLV